MEAHNHSRRSLAGRRCPIFSDAFVGRAGGGMRYPNRLPGSRTAQELERFDNKHIDALLARMHERVEACLAFSIRSGLS
jgi:hypothetical protein